MNPCVIREMHTSDWPAVRDIYAEGIKTGNATFEENTPTWKMWTEAHITTCRLVACLNDVVVGWIALSPVSSRCVYRGVAEVSVYVEQHHRGEGLGRKLLTELVSCSETQGFWTLQAGVFPENTSSLRLLAGGGFRIVGRHYQIGEIRGTWRDVLLLERRSEKVGFKNVGTDKDTGL